MLTDILQTGLKILLKTPRFALSMAIGNPSDSIALVNAVRDHFTLSSDVLAEAWRDSLVRSLIVMDIELNASANHLHMFRENISSKSKKQYKQRVRAEFFEPFIDERNLNEQEQRQLCDDLHQYVQHIKENSTALFPVTEMIEIDYARLFNEDVNDISESLLHHMAERADKHPAPNVHEFFCYKSLLGKAVLYFFRETLCNNTNVQHTLNALQQKVQYDDLKKVKVSLQQQKDAGDPQSERDLASLQAYETYVGHIEEQFADWQYYLDFKLQDLQASIENGFHEVKLLLYKIEASLRHHGYREDISVVDEVSRHLPSAEAREVNEVITKAKQSPDKQVRGQAYSLSATIAYNEGDYSKGKQELEKALEEEPDRSKRAAIHQRLFKLYIKEGQPGYEVALDHLKQAAELDPTMALWHVSNHTPLRILGAGGMGVALLVEDRLSQKRVLKTLWSNDREVIERFHKEASVMTKIAGPYVPKVYVFDDSVVHPYLAMEYTSDALDGEVWLETHGALTLAETLDVGLQLTEVLHIAHEQGIYHYDLKPANLLLRRTAEGLQITVIDFGLSSKATALHSQLERARNSGTSQLGKKIFGSLDYAPPEQTGEGNDVPGAWSDVYSMALTLYRLYTYESARRPDLHKLEHVPELFELFRDCIYKSAKQRPSLEEFRQTLIRVKTTEQTPTKEKPKIPTWVTTNQRLVLLGLTLVFVLVLASNWQRIDGSRTATGIGSVSFSEAEQNDQGVAADVAITPEDTQIFVQRARDGGEIQLAAGVFELDDPLILSNDVSIVGAGQGETVLEISAASVGGALRFLGAGELTLRDLTVRYVGDDFAHVIRIDRGTANLENVEVTGGKRDSTDNRYGSGVAFYNSDGVLEGNTLRNNEDSGTVFYGDSTGKAHNNVIKGNVLSGIAVGDNSQVTLEGNTLRNNEDSGIFFYGDSTGEARNNVSEGNGSRGIYVTNNSHVILEGNTLRSNESSGIAFFSDSTGEARNNVSEGNGWGISAANNSDVTLEGNTLSGNESSGIAFYGDSIGEARNNISEGNDWGISVKDNSDVTLQDNILRNNTFYGIWMHESATVDRQNNQFSDNGSGKTYTRPQ